MKSILSLILFVISLNAGAAKTTTTPETKRLASFKYSLDFILTEVLKYKKFTFDKAMPLPSLKLASVTPLSYYQDAIESQWRFRPDQIMNSYVVKSNEIFMLDDADYYEQKKRCIDDSLAHELTHYVQVVYQKYDLNDDDSLEMDAIDVQTRFREEHCR